MHSNTKKWSAEFLGTFWLTLGGCGSAVLAAAFPGVGIGLLGVSLAFGLTVVTGAYAFGPISGGHFNPAVSIGLVVGKRFSASELPGYIIAQVLGAIAASAVLFLIVSGKTGFTGVGGFATNDNRDAVAIGAADGRKRGARDGASRAMDAALRVNFDHIGALGADGAGGTDGDDEGQLAAFELGFVDGRQVTVNRHDSDIRAGAFAAVIDAA